MMVCVVDDGFMCFGKFLENTKKTNHQGVMVRKTITGDGFSDGRVMVFDGRADGFDGF